MSSDSPDDPPHGLAHDLPRFSRRRLMQLLGGAALVPILGCTKDLSVGPDAPTSAGGDAPGGPGGPGSIDASTSATCAEIPEETAGPYPGDGTNGPDVLTESGVVRSDIRASFGGATDVAAGVPVTLTFTITDLKSGCMPLAGYAVYVWHCDQNGDYSMYSTGVTDQNFLRGVQVTDAGGQVTFTTIFPGCYLGRWPHIHFEIYETVAAATSGTDAVATSQLAMPEATCNAVYATSGYETSKSNLTQISLATDMVFSDGATLETPATIGSAAAGYVATIQVDV